ncbi:hypothetical protein UF06_03320 [Vibrio sp. S234-5]|nr:hypothetical protein UF06_03320 [Vibrio sp. S234-5]
MFLLIAALFSILLALKLKIRKKNILIHFLLNVFFLFWLGERYAIFYLLFMFFTSPMLISLKRRWGFTQQLYTFVPMLFACVLWIIGSSGKSILRLMTGFDF